MDWKAVAFYGALIAAAVMLLAPHSAAAGAVRSLGDGVRNTLLGGAG